MLFIIAIVVAIVLSFIFQNCWILELFLIEITVASIVECIIEGFYSMNNGDSFVSVVENYINNELSQAIAIESIIIIMTCGVQLIVTYIKK